MKYSYSLTARIRAQIRFALEDYPDDKRQLEEYIRNQMPTMTTNYDAVRVSGNSESRQTEDTAMRILSSPYLRRLEFDCRAIERALSRCDDVDMRLIELVYFKRTHSVEGAGEAIGLTKTPAYNRINRILTVVALELGYIDFE